MVITMALALDSLLLRTLTARSSATRIHHLVKALVRVQDSLLTISPVLPNSVRSVMYLHHIPVLLVTRVTI